MNGRSRMPRVFDGGEWSKEWTEGKKERDGYAMGLVHVVEDKVVVARRKEEKSDFHKGFLIFLPS